MLKRYMKNGLKDYKEYREDIINYTIDVQKKFSKNNMIIFLFYGIYMYITDYFIWNVTPWGALFCFAIAGISLLDYTLFKTYLAKHHNMAIIAANIYIFFILKGLNYVYTMLPGMVSYILLLGSIFITAMINITPFQYRFLMVATTMIGLVEYFLAVPEATVMNILTRITDDILVLAFTIGINTVFSKLKYEEIKNRRILQDESIKDALTKLFNRKYMERYVKLYKEAHELCAMILIDLDNFKKVNDTFGHNKGDELLCQVSNILKKHFQNKGTVARLGGDEFMIFLPNISEREEVLEVIQKFLEEFPIYVSEGGETVIEVAVSVGVAFAGIEEPVFYEQLYKTSDDVMYKAKKGGKGKAVIAEDAFIKETVVTKNDIYESVSKQ